MSRRGMIRSDASAVKSAVERLRQYPNVTHVTVGNKVTNGLDVGMPALKVHVTAKKNVRGANLLPQTISASDSKGVRHRFAVDVIEAGGRPSLFGIRAGDRLLAFDRDLGLAGLVFTKGGKTYVLTNAHVACDVGDGSTGAMAWYQPPGPHPPLGPVVRATLPVPGRSVTADVAAVEVTNRSLAEPYRVVGSDLAVDQMAMMSRSASPLYLAAGGRFFPCFDPEPVAGDTPVEADGAILPYREFWQVKTADPIARKGLSGGVLLRRRGETLVACGLVFGGVPDHLLFAFSFESQFNRVYPQLN